MRPRFQVRTVTGYPTLTSRSPSHREHMSAHVMDTAFAWRVVKTFRTDGAFLVEGRRQRSRTDEAALRDAHEYADRLNGGAL